MPFASCTFVTAQVSAAVTAAKQYTDAAIANIPNDAALLARLGPALAPYLCPHCTAAPPPCTLTLGGAINDNAGARIGGAVECPPADRATYIGQGFVVLNDNSGAFLTMARTSPGNTCGITFSVALRDNAGAVLGYIPA